MWSMDGRGFICELEDAALMWACSESVTVAFICIVMLMSTRFDGVVNNLHNSIFWDDLNYNNMEIALQLESKCYL